MNVRITGLTPGPHGFHLVITLPLSTYRFFNSYYLLWSDSAFFFLYNSMSLVIQQMDASQQVHSSQQYGVIHIIDYCLYSLKTVISFFLFY